MSITGIIFITYFAVLLVGLFLLMVAKGYCHFEYLKAVYPEKLKTYSNIFDTFRDRFYNEYALLIIIPVFQRLKSKEKDEKTTKLGNTTTLICRLIYIDLIVILVTVIILIIFFHE